MIDGTWEVERVAAGLAALAHPTRLAILRQTSERRACRCRDVVGSLDLAQSTVSQHLKVLIDAGLLRPVADRRGSAYVVDGAVLRALSASVATLADTCCGPDPA